MGNRKSFNMQDLYFCSFERDYILSDELRTNFFITVFLLIFASLDVLKFIV